jgi:PTH1 family peptidyl-tRNA hydrolase
MSDERFLIVGLGNPGPRYAATRHNAGFFVLDELAGRIGSRFKVHKGSVELAEGRLAGRSVLLAKPRSYMNLSGGPVAQVSRFFKLEPARIVVVHDELDLPFGAVRLKRGGGEGGHNGLKSITAALGTRDYLRVRFGIGRPPGQQDPAEYVLREFTAAEGKDLEYLIDRAADAAEAVVSNGLEAAQNTFHS